jgi:hypothetical protein
MILTKMCVGVCVCMCVVTRRSDYPRLFDWRSGLLTTLTHDSWLFNYSAVPNLHTLQITTVHAKSSQSAVTIRFLVTVLKTGGNSASVPNCTDQDFSSQTPLQIWRTPKHASVITSRHGLRRKYRSLLYSNRFGGNLFVCEGVTQ